MDVFDAWQKFITKSTFNSAQECFLAGAAWMATQQRLTQEQIDAIVAALEKREENPPNDIASFELK